MEGMTYLAVAYFGMLVAIALWTWTVVQRSRRLDQRLLAMEAADKVRAGEHVRRLGRAGLGEHLPGLPAEQVRLGLHRARSREPVRRRRRLHGQRRL